MKAAALALTLAVGLAGPVVPAAQDVEPVASSTYAVVRAGGTFPQHEDLDGYDNGFAFEGGVGLDLASGLALEATVGRFAVDASVTGYDPDISGPATITSTASAISVGATLKAGVPLGSVHLYGLAGGALYFVTVDARWTASGYYPAEISDRDTTVGFHFGAGLSARVSPKASLGVEAKYVIASATLFDSPGNIDSLLVTGGLAYKF